MTTIKVSEAEARQVEDGYYFCLGCSYPIIADKSPYSPHTGPLIFRRLITTQTVVVRAVMINPIFVTSTNPWCWS
jgi:hypothetical protein